MTPETTATIVKFTRPDQNDRASSLRLELDQIRRQINNLEELITDGRSDRLLAQLVRSVIAHRRLRNTIFSEYLFADPAWDMMLELFAVALDQKRISVSSLCNAAGVPVTTGLRWIDKLMSEGLVQKCDDPFDRRRVWIDLSDNGVSKMKQYFNNFEAGPLPV